MNFDLSLVFSSLAELMTGASLSLQLTFYSAIIGLCLAIPIASAVRSQHWFIRWPAQSYTFFFRGSPLLVQIFLVYYGAGQFSEQLDSWHLWSTLREPYACALITFTLNTAAYTAELMRGAVQSLPNGEIEAGRAFGMSTFVLWRRIIIPKTIRQILPAYSNEFVLLLKATSLVSTITMLDLMGVARNIVARTYAPIEVFLATGLIYLVLTTIAMGGFRLTERWLNPMRASA